MIGRKLSMLLAIALMATVLLVPSAGAQTDAIGSVSGGGNVTTGDRFSGFATGGGPEAEGEGTWTHITPDGDRLIGTITSVVFRADGGGPAGPPQPRFNRAFVTGSGTWNRMLGFAFELSLADRGEPGNDEYTIAVVSPSGEVVYIADGLVFRGNLQIVVEG